MKVIAHSRTLDGMHDLTIEAPDSTPDLVWSEYGVVKDCVLIAGKPVRFSDSLTGVSYRIALGAGVYTILATREQTDTYHNPRLVYGSAAGYIYEMHEGSVWLMGNREFAAIRYQIVNGQIKIISYEGSYYRD